MAYEREAIADSTSAQPSQPQPVMREDRIVEPYKVRGPRPLAEAKPAEIGRSDTTSGNPPATGAEVPPPTAETVSLSPAASALARKEQKFRQSELALKAKEEALEVERKEIAELKALKARLAAKDYSGIEKEIPYDEYTNYLIEKEAGSDPVHQEIKKLEAKLTEVETKQKSEVDKRFEAAVSERRRAVTELVTKDDSYSSIRELKQEEAVVQHILDTWEHDNVDLTPEQAAKEVEEILLEKAARWAGLTKLKKTAEEPSGKQLPPLKAGIKTLTNNVTVTSDLKRPNRSFEGMSDSQRFAEARRRAEEKLKGN